MSLEISSAKCMRSSRHSAENWAQLPAVYRPNYGTVLVGTHVQRGCSHRKVLAEYSRNLRVHTPGMYLEIHRIEP